MAIGTGTASVQAAPIHYSETQSPDLPLFAETMTPLTLDLGSNTVSGSVSSHFNSATGAPITFDFDSFAFTVPAGMAVDSISVTAAHGNTGDLNFSATWSLGQGNYNSALYTELVQKKVPFDLYAPTTTTTFVTPGTALFAGDYSMNETTMLSQYTNSGVYLFTLNVVDAASLPEPASLTAVMAGTLTLLARRRSR
ncbi:MAG: hypothetical protein QM754_07600 [Tepidisphaeraceae bacterium]